MRSVLEVQTQSYSIGEFVTAIEGIEAGSTQYWALEVNGAYAEMGIGSYVLNEDMNFKWSLAEIEMP